MAGIKETTWLQGLEDAGLHCGHDHLAVDSEGFASSKETRIFT